MTAAIVSRGVDFVKTNATERAGLPDTDPRREFYTEAELTAIVETAAEADMGLIYGIGFPPFRGGALRYIDSIGVAEFVAMADKYADLGPLYHPTAKLREMAANGQRFYG